MSGLFEALNTIKGHKWFIIDLIVRNIANYQSIITFLLFLSAVLEYISLIDNTEQSFIPIDLEYTSTRSSLKEVSWDFVHLVSFIS